MENLLDVIDKINIAKNFVVCIYAACESDTPDGRSAICAVAFVAKEKMEDIIVALDEIRRRQVSASSGRAEA